uniref:BTB domain-containing protein n=1 Tax=Octopus bimaculoides TaxID=37653 RepID=A0A0L8I331_OCTBM
MYSNSTDLKFSNETTKVSLQNKIGAEACNVLMELRNTGQLCDAVIKVDEESFMIHRAILSACSPYFRVLFTNEKFEINRQEVTITDITVDIMRSIIQYAYTQDCCINHNNVKSLLVAADYFNIIGLLRICSEYLISQLNAHNCIGIEKFAQTYFCQELQQVAHRYLMVNFSEVYKVSNEFLQLNVDNVCEIFASDELNVRSEEITFNAIVRWVDHDPGSRVARIGQLLQTMRLGLLSTEYFVEKVKSHEYIKDNTSCKPVVIETLKFLCNLDVEKGLKINQNNHITRPRLPHDILFIFGGWSGNSTTNIIETYDSRADLWVKNTNIKSDYRAYHGTCVLDQLIYIIGGFDGTEYFNSVRCFDPIKQVWSEAAPMYTKRCYISVVVLHSFIYAMGGYDGQVRQNTAERYNKSKNQWSFIQPMHHQRSDASATVLYGK